MNKKRLIVLIGLLIPVLLFPQAEQPSNKSWYRNWRLGSYGGISYLATELKKDFSRADMDMNSNPKAAFFFTLNKRLNKNIEAGIEYEKNYFAGSKTYPDNINWLVYHSRFNNSTSDFVPHPVYSKTNITSYFFNLHVNFLNFQTNKKNAQNMNMYLKAGAGISSLGVEMGYVDQQYYAETNLQNPLYEKGQGIQPEKDMYGTFHLGTGINYYLTPRISVSSELIFLFVSTDYLDGIQNYEVTHLPNNNFSLSRMGVLGTVAELKVGISYHFNLYSKFISNGLWEQKFEDYKNDYFIYKKEEKVKPVNGSNGNNSH